MLAGDVQSANGLSRIVRHLVELLRATIPPGYLADAFVSLHADGDDHREARGFKIARGFYRGPHEDALVTALTDTYAAATGMPWDDNVSGDMTDYYAPSRGTAKSTRCRRSRLPRSPDLDRDDGRQCPRHAERDALPQTDAIGRKHDRAAEEETDQDETGNE